LRKGWAMTPKDKSKPRIDSGSLCDKKALGYAREKIGEELKTVPYRARFIDCTMASLWYECWNPAHPMTRSDSKLWRVKLLDLVRNDFRLVCGSENGHEISVPSCDFYEGMMSLGPYRVPDSGRKIQDIWDEVPELTAKFQVAPEYRLPLWELVFHDCTVSYWYWGDYNNKLPSLWRKRDLFNALYGVPPMYMFRKSLWDKNREQFAASYKTAQPVSELTGWSAMTDHCILSKDRLVQQTRFANGVTVTVNFGTQPFVMSDGYKLSGDDLRIEQ
ncbi:MAG: glycoside hydrolase, partial [Planctomycetia bacterium]|nr:glycoside hydrolase [Planctomycetia bacterium]